MRLRTARTMLRSIVNRAHINPAYREQLREHPVEVLLEEGLPYDVIEDFLKETLLQPEVSGYLLQGCANTCALTSINTYPDQFLSSINSSD